MESIEPVQEPYDNEISLLYKWAQYFKLPSRLVIIDDGKYIDPHVVFRDLSPEQITQDYGENLENKDDIVMLYYDMIRPEDVDEITIGEKEEILEKVDSLNTELGIETEEYTQSVEIQFNDLEAKYFAWSNQNAEIMEKEKNTLNTIVERQKHLEILDKQPQLPASEPEITKIGYRYSPKRRNGEELESFEIFDEMRINRRVPFARFISVSEETFTKIYTGEIFEQDPNYASITDMIRIREDQKNVILFVLWIGDPGETDENVFKSPRDNFVVVKYDLENNFLTVDFSIKTIDDITIDSGFIGEKLAQAFPTLDLGLGEIVKINVNFNLYGVEIDASRYDDLAFVDMIMNFPLFRNYIYIEESNEAYSQKKRLEIHYRGLTNKSDLAATIIPNLTIDKSVVEGIEIPPETPYLQINIHQGANERVVSDFIYIFKLLMLEYNERSDSVLREYYRLLPELARITAAPIASGAKRVAARSERPIDLLRQADPENEIFGTKYTTRCQRDHQPRPIPASEIQNYTSQRFTFRGQEYNRQVLSFPPNNPKIHLVCDSTENPFPGVIERGDIKAKYDYVPCCFSENQMESTRETNYLKMVRGVAPVVSGAVAETELKTYRFLNPFTRGSLSTTINNLLKEYSPKPENRFVRYGVPLSVNSLLHCVFISLNDKIYIEASGEQRERIVRDYRMKLAKKFPAILYKQELYDHTDEEIRRLIENPDIFFDSQLFYRAIEEDKGVNLYVFRPENEKRGVKAGFLLPRYDLFHVRPLRERETILVLQHWGTKADNALNPQCELIIEVNDVTREILNRAFDSKMATICHTAMFETNKTKMWVNDIVFSPQNYDLTGLFDNIIGQIIDDYGKGRGIVIQKDDKTATIGLSPFQPLAVGEMRQNRIPIGDAISLFDQPPDECSVEEDMMTGLWFADNLVYVPIVAHKKIGIKIGKPNPFGDGGISPTHRLQGLRKTLDWLKQIINWIYIVESKKRDFDVDEFISQNFIQGEYEGDSINAYDLTRIPRILPRVQSSQAALASLRDYAPSLIDEYEGHYAIKLYNVNFTDKIVRSIKRYFVEHEGLDQEIPRYITGYYQEASNFKRQPNVLVFVTQRDFMIWLNRTRQITRSYIVQQRIENSFAHNMEPFLFSYEEEDYIVQNVGRDQTKAIKLTQLWKRDNINYGPYIEPLEGPTPDYSTLTFRNGQLTVLREGKTSKPVIIYEYEIAQSPMYAALLNLTH